MIARIKAIFCSVSAILFESNTSYTYLLTCASIEIIDSLTCSLFAVARSWNELLDPKSRSSDLKLLLLL